MEVPNPPAVLYDALRQSGMAHMATTLVRLQISSLDDLLLQQDAVLAAGVHQWQLERVLAQADPLPQPKCPTPQRKDLPVMQPRLHRASLTLALAAASPNNRSEALAAFERDILARSTFNPSQESRVRTYRAICRAWGLQAFPMTLETIRCFGASMKAGHYRSVAVYYQAAIGFQARHLRDPIEPFLRGAIRDAVRSVKRGLGPSSLKESFDPFDLIVIPISQQVEPFRADNVSHMLDVAIFALWYMLREIELAAAKLRHVTLHSATVDLLIPSSKMDSAGSWTTRTLRCACRYQQKFLCLWHAAFRHLKRVRVHPAFNNTQEFPLVPNESGGVMTKHRIIGCLRTLLDAAAIPITRVDEHNNRLFRFGGHAFRVSGAQMLGAGGLPIQLIQLLGRWSSQTIQKYVQQSHLAVVPTVPEQLLNNRPSQFMQDEAHVPPATVGSGSEPSTTPSSTTVQPRRLPNKIPEAWTTKFTDHEKALEELSKQVAALTLAFTPPNMSLVVRRKSNIVHKGFDYESHNPPGVWKTPCGWSYGCSNFYRVPVVDTDHVKCRRCFNISDGGSSDSEDHQDDDDKKDDTSSSDSTSSEDDAVDNA